MDGRRTTEAGDNKTQANEGRLDSNTFDPYYVLKSQVFGRKSERRVHGEGQLFLDPGDEAAPEVPSALEEAVRQAKRVESAEQEKQQN